MPPPTDPRRSSRLAGKKRARVSMDSAPKTNMTTNLQALPEERVKRTKPTPSGPQPPFLSDQGGSTASDLKDVAKKTLGSTTLPTLDSRWHDTVADFAKMSREGKNDVAKQYWFYQLKYNAPTGDNGEWFDRDSPTAGMSLDRAVYRRFTKKEMFVFANMWENALNTTRRTDAVTARKFAFSEARVASIRASPEFVYWQSVMNSLVKVVGPLQGSQNIEALYAKQLGKR